MGKWNEDRMSDAVVDCRLACLLDRDKIIDQLDSSNAASASASQHSTRLMVRISISQADWQRGHGGAWGVKKGGGEGALKMTCPGEVQETDVPNRILLRCIMWFSMRKERMRVTEEGQSG